MIGTNTSGARIGMLVALYLFGVPRMAHAAPDAGFDFAEPCHFLGGTYQICYGSSQRVFPRTAVGTASEPVVVYIVNVTSVTPFSGVELTLANLRIAGPDADQFSIADTSECPNPIEADSFVDSHFSGRGSCRLLLAFTPKHEAGLRTATLEFDAHFGQRLVCGINGCQPKDPPDFPFPDTHAKMDLEGLGVGLFFSPSFRTGLDFGSQAVGTFSGVRTLTIGSNSDAGVKLTDVNLTTALASPHLAGNFTIVTNTCRAELTLATGQTCNIQVQFQPRNDIPSVGRFTVTSVDPGSPYNLGVFGLGTIPVPIFPASRFSFREHEFSGPFGSFPGCLPQSASEQSGSGRISQFFGSPNADGTLARVSTMVEKGIVGPRVMVTVFAYLVNRTSGGAGIPRGQTHRFFLNGHELGSSAGDASLIEQQTQGFWIRKVYTVPIEWLHFPRRGDPEGRFASERAPVGGDNPVRVTIAPVAGEEVWCTVVKPWTVRVTGMSPVVMIHCNDCLATLWEQVGFKTYLDSINVPNDNSIQLPHTLDNFPKPNCNGFADVRIASFRGNAAIIENRLSRILESFGANSVHLVAHSKGGLDSREWLATYSRRHNNKNGFNVLSLTTADTPHRGSAHADAQMAWEQVGWTGLLDEFLNGPPDPGGLMADLGHSLTGVNCGKPFLTTQNVNGAFNPANVPLLPADVVYQAISADADNDGDGHMFLAHAGLVGIPFDNVADIPEWGGLTYADSSLKSVAEHDPPVAAKVADTMYHFLKDVGSVSVQATVGFKFVFPFGFVPVYGTSIVEEGTGGRNDTAVTIESASGPPGGAFKHILSFVGANGRDHVAVIDDGVAAAVVPYLLLVEQQRQR